MKRFALLKLQNGGNLVINELEAHDKKRAIYIFRSVHPELCLDEEGYAQHPIGHITYCVAEYAFNR